MNTLVTGASGLVGSALLPLLVSKGHRITRMVRTKSRDSSDEILWDPRNEVLAPAAIEGFENIIHLAGENIAGGRWNAERKRRIRDSRVKGTRLLAEALAGTTRPPKVMVCASAIGFYGDRRQELLTEDSRPGRGFLPDVCQEWEKAAGPAAERGIRIVNLRIGVVLSPKGGALAKMLLPFRLGLGGKIGSGDQFMSWIALDDLVRIVHYAIHSQTLEGPVNAVAPNPATNREFTSKLGRVLSRPTFLTLPAFAARLFLGEMADGLLLASTRVEPAALRASGYKFRFSNLENALNHMLK